MNDAQVGYHGNQSLSDSEPIDTERSAKDALLSPRSIPADGVEEAKKAVRRAFDDAYEAAVCGFPVEMREEADKKAEQALNDLILACQPPHAQEIEKTKSIIAQGSSVERYRNPEETEPRPTVKCLDCGTAVLYGDSCPSCGLGE